MLLEVFLGHRLICGLILAINEMLLPHLKLSLSLSKLQLLHISCRTYRHGVELMLISCFIVDLIMAKIEMSLPQFVFHLNIILISLCRCRASASIWKLVGGSA